MNFRLKGKFLAVFILTLALTMMLSASVFAVTPSLYFLSGDESASGTGYTYVADGTKGTLTLNNYTGESGIEIIKDIAEVVLIDGTTNTITLNDHNEQSYLRGIFSNGDLIISGSGTLNIFIDAMDVSSYGPAVALCASRDIIIKDSAEVNISVKGNSNEIYAIEGYDGITIQDTASVDIFVENPIYGSCGLYTWDGGVNICSTANQVITMSGDQHHVAIKNYGFDGESRQADSNDIVISGANLQINFPVENSGYGFSNATRAFGKLEILNGAAVVINGGNGGIYDNTLEGADGIKIENSALTINGAGFNGICANVTGIKIIDSTVNVTSNSSAAIRLEGYVNTSKIDISGSSIVNIHSNNQYPVFGDSNSTVSDGISEIDLSSGGRVTVTSDSEYADYVWQGLVRMSERTKLEEGFAYGGGSTPNHPAYEGADIYGIDDITKRLVFASKAGFKVEVLTFEDSAEGDEITAVPITITAVGGDRTIKSVTIDDDTHFELIGADSIASTLVSDETSNTAVTIKPVAGLQYGNYETRITVTDSEDNTYIATARINVISPKRINITCADDWHNKNQINDNTIFTLANDVSLEGLNSVAGHDALTIRANLTIDLNGYSLILPAQSVKLWYYGDYTVNIIDSSFGKTGKIIRQSVGNNGFVLANLSYTASTGVLIIDGITYQNQTTDISREISVNEPASEDRRIYILINDSTFDIRMNLFGMNDVLSHKDAYTFEIENSIIKSYDNDKRIYLDGYNALTYADFIDTDKMSVYGDDVLLSNTQNVNVTPGHLKLEIKRKEGFDVTALTFDEVVYGYGTVTPKAIDITAIGSDRTIASVTVDGSEFAITPGTPSEVVQDNTNSTYLIAPVTGLSAGTHTATITVTDTATPSNAYTTTVTFVVGKTNLTSFAVSLEGWNTNESPKEPQITGNTGAGEVTYEYKVKDAEDSTYSEAVPTKAGTYTVRATVAETTNYNQATATADFTLTFAPATHIVTTPEQLNERLFYSDAVKEEVTVKLGASIDVAEIRNDPTVYVNADLTIDLNGKTLTLDTEDFKFWYYGSYTVKIIDSSAEGTGKIVVNRNASDGIALVMINDNEWDGTSKFILDGIDVERTTNSYGVLKVWNSNEEANKFDITIKNTNFKIYDQFINCYFTANNLNVSIEPTTTVSRNDYASALGIANGNNSYSTFIDFAKSKVMVTDVMDGEERELDPSAPINGRFYSIRIVSREGFEVTAPTFANATFGYGDITAQPISIATIGSDRTVKSVNVSDASKFTVEGTGTPTIVEGTPNTLFTIKPKTGLNAGTHTATITVIDSDDNPFTAPVTFVVEKATPTCGAPIGLTATYGDTLANVSLPSGTGEGSWVWKESTSTEVGDVGSRTHKAVFIPTDNTNYETVEYDVTIVVSRANQAFVATAENKTITYGETLEYPFTLSTGDGNITYSSSSDEYVEVNEDGTLTANKVTTTPITITVTASGTTNYSEATTTYTVAVTKAKLAKPTATTETFTFDNSAKTLNVNNVVSQITQTLGTLTETYVGNYSVTYGLTDTTNYCWSDDDTTTPVTIDWSITPVTSEITLKPFVGANINLVRGQSIDLKDLIILNPSEYLDEVTFDFEVGEAHNGGTIVGTELQTTPDASTTIMRIVASFAGKNMNSAGALEYSTAEKKFSIVLVDKTSVALSGLTYTDKTYDGAAVTPTGTLTFILDDSPVAGLTMDDVDVTYTGREGTTYGPSGESPVNAGKYTVTYAIKATNATYTGTVSYDYEITKVQIAKPTAVDTTIAFDNSEKTLNVNVDTLHVEKTEGTIKETYVGNYSVTYGLIDTTNYCWAGDNSTTPVAITWSITPHTSTILKASEYNYQLVKGQSVDLNTLVLLNPSAYSSDVTFALVGTPTGISLTDEVLSAAASAATGEVKVKVNFAGKELGGTPDLEYTVAPEVELTINIVDKTPVTLSGLTYGNKAYDESAVAPTGELAFSVAGLTMEDVDVTYTGRDGTYYSSTAAPVNAGKYTVTYAIKDTNATYTGSKTYNFEITPASSTITTKSSSNKLQRDKEVNLKTLINLVPATHIDEVTFTIELLPTGVTLDGTTLKATSDATLGNVTVKANFAGKDLNSDGTKEYSPATELTFDVEVVKPASTGGGGAGGSVDVSEYTIKVEAGEGGTAKATPSKVARGENAKIKVSAYEGYEVEDVIVDGKSVGATREYEIKNIKKDILVKVTFKKINTAPVEKMNFIDVKENDWFYDAVKFAVENKLMNGISEATFAPETTTTRAMVVTILYRLENEASVTRNNVFSDVENDMWYSDAIAWANEKGIVLGMGNGEFAPDAEITREQLVTILYRYANYKKLDTSIGENTNILSYDDAFEISEYAIPAIQWACGEGLINGVGNNLLDSKGNATRAQIATIIMRFIENM